MGKVFSWTQVVNGHIPRPNDFATIESELQRQLSASPIILGATICGSLVWKTHNHRSDIDCVAIYDSKNRAAAHEVFANLQHLAQRLYVPLDLIPVDVEIAQTSMHNIDFFFGKHINICARQGGMIKKNPYEFLSFGHITPIEAVRDYIRNRLHKLEKDFVNYQYMNESDQTEFLRKILETPVYLARKLLDLHKKSPTQDSKQAICDSYHDIAASDVYRLFEQIVQINERYSRELRVQLIEPNEQSYKKLLITLTTMSEVTIEFLRRNALQILK